jgi:putative hydrolase of the HAD superfamily
VAGDRRIRGVLFDAGGVLIRPIGGRWNPRYDPIVEVFPDVRRVLDQLRASGVRMSVVSDTWAGLEATLRSLDIEQYFAGFVIAEVLGCRKPDPRMYAAGSDLLGLNPGDCLFIDDDPQLVSAAIQLGYHGAALTRAGQPTASVPAIMSLGDLPPIITRTAQRT